MIFIRIQQKVCRNCQLFCNFAVETDKFEKKYEKVIRSALVGAHF